MKKVLSIIAVITMVGMISVHAKAEEAVLKYHTANLENGISCIDSIIPGETESKVVVKTGNRVSVYTVPAGQKLFGSINIH